MSGFPAELVQLVPGLVLDRYELVCLIARGGMGSVWLARHVGKHGFERLVALKSVLPEHAVDERYRKMFLDEASIASRIAHPNVAGTIDLGEARGVLYFIMEWVDGDSLRKLREATSKAKTPFPIAIALRLVSDAAGGLHAAHELRNEAGQPLNIVHRDVSPHNVLVSVDGIVKVIDFGIAMARERRSDATKTDELKGKLDYMAPEQAMGQPVDRRSDLWALGAVLYYLLAGVPPHQADTTIAAVMKRVSGVAPPPLPPSVPAQVRAVVAKALHSAPDQRYATALDMQHALETAMQACGAVATPADVAAFARKHLAGSIQRRKDAVQAAIDKANHRQKSNVQLLAPLDEASSPGIPIAEESDSDGGSGESIAPEESAASSEGAEKILDRAPQSAPVARVETAAAEGADEDEVALGLPSRRSARMWLTIGACTLGLGTAGLAVVAMRPKVSDPTPSAQGAPRTAHVALLAPIPAPEPVIAATPEPAPETTGSASAAAASAESARPKPTTVAAIPSKATVATTPTHPTTASSSRPPTKPKAVDDGF